MNASALPWQRNRAGRPRAQKAQLLVLRSRQAALTAAQGCGARTGTRCRLGAAAVREAALARVMNSGRKERCTPSSNATVTDSASRVTTTPLPWRRARTVSPGAKGAGAIAEATLVPGALPASKAQAVAAATGFPEDGPSVLRGAETPRALDGAASPLPLTAQVSLPVPCIPARRTMACAASAAVAVSVVAAPQRLLLAALAVVAFSPCIQAPAGPVLPVVCTGCEFCWRSSSWCAERCCACWSASCCASASRRQLSQVLQRGCAAAGAKCCSTRCQRHWPDWA